ncbi:related to cysteinyl-tRNA synthetase [Lecanosticta acicola]|uniref:cysteine--tRNA ligase n=1 Tax=Lecanosticta acicola TaxID=111012 RepID=A0AAI9ECG1_9PEZI|nr:related to cysteinyl-tRNA synthetase [Lecanosticta acicola]
MATAQPEWRAPPEPSEQVRARLPRLSVYNSLTRSKTPFVPIDPEGKKVGWYACGPTVYDDSHLGHARNYVSQDIIRRIMSDYFKFQVFFVMNITDVDDKIILAARQQHLLSQFLNQHKEVDEEVRKTTLQAFQAYVQKNLPMVSHELAPEDFAEAVLAAYGHVLNGKSLANDNSPPGEKEAKVKMHLKTSTSAAEALLLSKPSLDEFGAKASGALLPYIDSLHASTVTGKDHDIFTNLTKRYEARFFDDMKALNVLYPDKLTRVTEYGPQIVDFVKRIQDHGFAYANEGSVYYDTTAWEQTGGVYARLEPWNRNDQELQADGEGSLSAKKTGFKKSGADFALWKASKAGEPSWESPWGEGRPGWHIECSAMASDILGEQFDIHSGGIDLAFPHHDNELAQSEAYWAESGKDSKQWVNYFLHMGHLGIAGAKMSKSLKNFKTIKEALDEGLYNPRSLRMVFLLGAWKEGLEISISPDAVSAANQESDAWEEKVNNFFLKVRDIQMHPTSGQSNAANGRSGQSDDLEKEFESSKQKLDEALRDSFDTPRAMRIISELVTTYNSASYVSDETSIAIGKWITEILVMFGLDANYREGQMGWSGIEIPEVAKPFIYAVSELRDKIRSAAIKGNFDLAALGRLDEKDTVYGDDQPYAKVLAGFQRKVVELYTKNAPAKDYLAACDDLRDDKLWSLGIYLEDREGRHALVRPLSASLRKERADREANAKAKAAAKEKAKADAEKAETERLEKGRLSHLDMYRTSEYSEWDSEGLPTKDAAGNEVAKSKTKKLKKDWERQKKLHEAFQAMQVK